MNLTTFELNVTAPKNIASDVFQFIVKAARRGESSTILSMPGVGKRRIINNFVQNTPDYIQAITESPQEITPSSIHALCLDIKANFYFEEVIRASVEGANENAAPILLIDSIDEIFDNKEVMDNLLTIHTGHEQMISAWSSNIGFFHNRKNFAFLSKYEFLSQNIYYFKGFTISDMEKLLTAMLAHYGFTIAKQTYKEILQLAGGNLTIAHLLVRALADGIITEKDLTPAESHLLYKKYLPLEMFFHEFLMKLGDDLSSSLLRHNFSNEPILKNLGIVDNQNNLFSSIFDGFLQDTDVLREFKLIKPQDLKYLDKFQNRLEPQVFKIFNLLLVNKPFLVTREDIAKTLWGAAWTERYSEWAIDRAISKLRKQLPKNMKIHTKRGFGYWLEQA